MSRAGEHILAFAGVLFIWLKNMSTNWFVNMHVPCWTRVDILNNFCFRCFRKIAKADHEFRHVRLSVLLHGKIRPPLDGDVCWIVHHCDNKNKNELDATCAVVR